MYSGDFTDDAGREYSFEILEIEGYNGEELDEQDIQYADKVFYKVEGNTEVFYRWVGGPFESMGDIETAIEDETDFYE